MIRSELDCDSLLTQWRQKPCGFVHPGLVFRLVGGFGDCMYERADPASPVSQAWIGMLNFDRNDYFILDDHAAHQRGLRLNRVRVYWFVRYLLRFATISNQAKRNQKEEIALSISNA